jgi:predicted glycoside hydrolase/deacetylase ChbG (UPF0249 family)
VVTAFVIEPAQQATVPALIPIVFCADDFGLESGVDQAIISLAQQGRISATGCLVQAPNFGQSAQALRGLPIDLGLHLNLTERLVDAVAPIDQPVKGRDPNECEYANDHENR